MRKLIMWNVITLDGYFEGTKSWDLDFHETAWGPELEKFSVEQLGKAGAILYGRVTYEGMAAYWQTESGTIAELMNSIPKVVFSRTLKKADWNNTRLVAGDAGDEVERLKGAPGKDLYVFGSGALCDSLLARRSFDEINICVAPTLLGNGRALFKSGAPTQPLRLLEARALGTGAVLSRYATNAV
jgi:dihydrofolate reductase